MVSRILRNEAYTGILICHKSERNKINKTFRFTAPEEQFRHEGIIPAIISRELWQEVQALMDGRKAARIRSAPGCGLLRYGGLLRCADCGRSFVGKRIKLKSGERIQYVCDTYHCYGKEHCTAHVVWEELLDKLIIRELIETKRMYQQNWDSLQILIDRWASNNLSTADRCGQLRKWIENTEDELEAILMERIRDKGNADRYDRMIQKREAEIESLKKQIAQLESLETTLRERQAVLRRDIRMMDDILAEGRISEANLRLLVEKIYIGEADGKLDVDIHLKAPFRTHGMLFEHGEVVDAWASLDFDFDRLGAILLKEFQEEPA